MKRGVTSAVLAAAFVFAACVGGKAHISSEDKARLAPYVLDALPADATKIDVNFENKVHLVGFKIEPPTTPPGTKVKATYYWRCDEPLDEGWQLFTHIQHEGFDRPDNLDGNGPLREIKDKTQVLGPDRWERGKVYVDEQTFTMPTDLRGPESILYVGIFRGDARLRIMPGGPTDGDNRAIVTHLKTGVAKREEKRVSNDVPRIEPMKLGPGEKIVVDGKGEDKAWANAVSTGAFVDVGTGKPATASPIQGTAKMTWDDERMYVLVEVHDPDLVGWFKDKDSQPEGFTAAGQPKLWEHACAEVMVDPDGDGDDRDYYEMQFSPQGRVFKSWFETLQKPNGGPNGPFGHEEWDPKLKVAVVAKGTIDDHSDRDEGYTVEIGIPWGAFEKGAKNRPPKPGDQWRMNFYAMKDNGGPSWSPILGKGNFHFAPRFGRVTWVTKDFVEARADGGAPDGGAKDPGPLDGGRATVTDAAVPSDGGRRHLTPSLTMPPHPPPSGAL